MRAAICFRHSNMQSTMIFGSSLNLGGNMAMHNVANIFVYVPSQVHITEVYLACGTDVLLND